MADVSLVVMPYACIAHPSIAIGMLTACLRGAGIRVMDHYANLWFADEIGLNDFYFVGQLSNTDLIGEWTFAGSAFPDFQPDHSEYLKPKFQPKFKVFF